MKKVETFVDFIVGNERIYACKVLKPHSTDAYYSSLQWHFTFGGHIKAKLSDSQARIVSLLADKCPDDNFSTMVGIEGIVLQVYDETFEDNSVVKMAQVFYGDSILAYLSFSSLKIFMNFVKQTTSEGIRIG
jgi:hypothetical protein